MPIRPELRGFYPLDWKQLSAVIRLKLVCDAPGVRVTRVWLATAHLDHDTTRNDGRNLKALCQRCHLIHDRPEHRRRRWLTLRMRKAVEDLFIDNL